MKERERGRQLCVCVCIKIYIYMYVCMCSARAFMLFCRYTKNYFPKEREFFLFLLIINGNFSHAKKKKCQQQHGEQLCCEGEPCRQNAFTHAVVVVVRRPTKAAFRLLSRRTRTRQKPCRFSFSYLQVCFVLYLI